VLVRCGILAAARTGLGGSGRAALSSRCCLRADGTGAVERITELQEAIAGLGLTPVTIFGGIRELAGSGRRRGRAPRMADGALYWSKHARQKRSSLWYSAEGGAHPFGKELEWRPPTPTRPDVIADTIDWGQLLGHRSRREAASTIDLVQALPGNDFPADASLSLWPTAQFCFVDPGILDALPRSGGIGPRPEPWMLSRRAGKILTPSLEEIPNALDRDGRTPPCAIVRGSLAGVPPVATSGRRGEAAGVLNRARPRSLSAADWFSHSNALLPW